MKIYHLVIKDNDDGQYDMHLHYSHPTKNASDLWGDYTNAYAKVIDSDKDWIIKDVTDELENMGWTYVDIEKVEVEY